MTSSAHCSGSPESSAIFKNLKNVINDEFIVKWVTAVARSHNGWSDQVVWWCHRQAWASASCCSTLLTTAKPDSTLKLSCHFD